MLAVNIFIIILLTSSISANNDTIPEIPSHFVSDTKLLPEQSESTKTHLLFQEYIPVACFCDWSNCSAYVRSIEAPIIGLFTRDGKIVKSLNAKVNQGELMYIILIDRKSSLADDTYLERTSYWRLVDSQHQLLAGVPLDFEIRRQVSVSVLKENNLQFFLGNETKYTVITALEMSTGLSILTHEEFERKTYYHYSASQFSQVVGVYQLVHELSIQPGIPLTNYIGSQTTGARCSSYLVVRGACGSVQLLPSLLQRTSVFRQVTVNFTTTDSDSLEIVDDLKTTDGNHQESKRRGLSRKAKVTIISLSIAVILLPVFVVAIWYYYKRRDQYIKILTEEEPILSEHSDDNLEL